MRKCMVWLVTLVLCLCASGVALGWYCPGCDIDNSGNFCEECGQSKAAEERLCPGCGYDASLIEGAKWCPACGDALPVRQKVSQSVVVTEASLAASGAVHLVWTDSASAGPYTLGYQQMTGRADEPVYTLPDKVEGTEADVFVVPGKDYTFYVYDAQGGAATLVWTAGAVPKFESFPVPIKVSPKTVTTIFGGSPYVTQMDRFYCNDILTYMPIQEYAIQSPPTLPQLGKPRHYTWMLTVEAPSGFAMAVDVAAMDVKNDMRYYFEVGLNEYFRRQIQRDGRVEAGEHVVTLYWDGMYVSEDVLLVEE